MPDVVIWMKDRNWLVLVEAVTSHGPINSLRKVDLANLLQGWSCFCFRLPIRDNVRQIRPRYRMGDGHLASCPIRVTLSITTETAS